MAQRLTVNAADGDQRGTAVLTVTVAGGPVTVRALRFAITRQGYEAAHLGPAGWQVSEVTLEPADVAAISDAALEMLVGPDVVQHMSRGNYQFTLKGGDLSAEVTAVLTWRVRPYATPAERPRASRLQGGGVADADPETATVPLRLARRASAAATPERVVAPEPPPAPAPVRVPPLLEPPPAPAPVRVPPPPELPPPPPPPPPVPPVPIPSPVPRPWLRAALVALVAIGGGALAYWMLRPAPLTPREQAIRFLHRTPPPTPAQIYARAIEFQQHREMTEAIPMLRRAADLHFGLAAHALGHLYDPRDLSPPGSATPRFLQMPADAQFARIWYRRAIQDGDATAQPDLQALGAPDAATTGAASAAAASGASTP